MAHVICDSCDRILEDGEVYYESLILRRVVGKEMPKYAAKSYECVRCHDGEEWTP
jgi:hypothetical protein